MLVFMPQYWQLACLHVIIPYYFYQNSFKIFINVSYTIYLPNAHTAVIITAAQNIKKLSLQMKINSANKCLLFKQSAEKLGRLTARYDTEDFQ